MELLGMNIDTREAYDTILPLALITGGITLYGVFIFNFYRFLSQKDVFPLELKDYGSSRWDVVRQAFAVVFHLAKYLIVYPICVFFWFCVMTALLYLLSSNQTIEIVMLIAMGVVGSIRVCAYYNEALSTDIAKILPYALLGIMIINNRLLSFTDPTEDIWEVAVRWETVAYYLCAVVLLEVVLRTGSGILWLYRRARKSTGSPMSSRQPA